MHSIKTTLRALVLCTLALAFAQMSYAAEDFKGNWTLAASKEAGHVRLALMHRMHGGSSHHESDWLVSSLQGLDLAARGKRDVQFGIVRDAGRFNCEGYLNNGEGAGLFHFVPDAKFAQAMSALGFDGIDDDKQFAMAVHDVTLEFAKAMKAERLTGLNTEMLFAFRIHGVTPAMVRDVRKSGLAATEDQLIAMRIHGID
jgi:hypothetical protein